MNLVCSQLLAVVPKKEESDLLWKKNIKATGKPYYKKHNKVYHMFLPKII